MLVSSRNMNHRGFVVNERRARLEYRNTNGKHLDHGPGMTKARGSSLFDVGAAPESVAGDDDAQWPPSANIGIGRLVRP